MTERLEVIEVLGAGRTGSTVLDRELGRALGAPSMGELMAVFRRGFLENQPCTCGAPFDRCPFWRAVVAEAPAPLDRMAAAATVLAMNRLLGVTGPRRVLTASRRRALASTVDPRWFASVAALFRGVATVTGSSVLVDSSKAPVLAHLLAQVDGIEVRPVHLVRDARAVAYSWSHPGPPVRGTPALPVLHPVKAALVWSIVNAGADAVTRELAGRSPFVRIEDVVAEERADAIDEERGARWLALLRRCAIDPPRRPELTALGVEAAAGRHMMSGNPRVRVATEPRPRGDDRWRAMSPATQAAVLAVTWPWMLRYGYLRPTRERLAG